jgi:hypothetical protein
MENRRAATDKLQLATSLWCAKIHAIIHKDLKIKKVCALWVSRDLKPKQIRESCRSVRSSSLSQQGPRGIPCQTSYW